MSNLDCFWEEPSLERFLRRLASFSRLILFDKRGTGLSDRVTESPTLEERMDDVRAVMDAVGSVRAALLGYSEGGPMCVLFAATYPERTESVVMIGSYARRFRAPDYPWGPTPEEHEAYYDTIQRAFQAVVGALAAHERESLNSGVPGSDERADRYPARLACNSGSHLDPSP
jgi:pimeloyl-ACP methyl ester carboxylesterase